MYEKRGLSDSFGECGVKLSYAKSNNGGSVFLFAYHATMNNMRGKELDS